MDPATLQKIAHLARLEFDTQAADKMSKDLSQVLEWVAQLQEIDTESVAPLTHMSSEINSTRADEISTPLSQEEALKNAPKKDTSFVIVPKVMD